MRDKNIELALSSITKTFGEGSIMRLGSNSKMKVETLSTGSLAIDLALGVGGLPLGRIVEIYGPESSGKTTFCLSVIAEADYIVDLGPEAGVGGGEVVATGTPEQVAKNRTSRTAPFLRGVLNLPHAISTVSS